MSATIVYQCVKCGAPIEPKAERVYYECSYCHIWQKFEEDADGRRVLLSLQAAIERLLSVRTSREVKEEEEEWRDFIVRTQGELVRRESEIPLAEAEAAKALAEQKLEEDRLSKFVLGFGAGLVVMFLLAVAQGGSTDAVLWLALAIACAAGLAYHLNKWLALRREPMPAVRTAQGKVDALRQDCDEMKNDIAGATKLLELLNRQILIEQRNKLRSGRNQPAQRG